jgi:hypothetical protein
LYSFEPGQPTPPINSFEDVLKLRGYSPESIHPSSIGDWVMSPYFDLGVAALGGGIMAGRGGARAPKFTPPAAEPRAPGTVRISPRAPQSAEPIEDPLRTHLKVDTEAMAATPMQFERNMANVPSYPGFASTKGMSPEETAEAYINQSAGNLEHLYRNSPQELRERGPNWYEGAHDRAAELAQRWGLPQTSVAGAIAALSPQKDWFQNASLAERMGDVMTSPAAGRPMTGDMQRMAPQLYTDPAARRAVRPLYGRSLDELTDPAQMAMWIRLYDEAHNPRGFRSMNPEGVLGDFVRTKSGKPWDVAWGSGVEGSKAVQALQSGGDTDAITRILTSLHKVPSFYNNIADPYGRYGDVTVDTHAVGANQLRSVSQKTPAVGHSLATAAGASGSDLSGTYGTYGVNADAIRRASEMTGLSPRQMQSVTWEGIRGLFPWAGKSAKSSGAVDDLWRAYDRGEASLEQTRRAILEHAGGIRPPSWSRSGAGEFDPDQRSSYR